MEFCGAQEAVSDIGNGSKLLVGGTYVTVEPTVGVGQLRAVLGTGIDQAHTSCVFSETLVSETLFLVYDQKFLLQVARNMFPRIEHLSILETSC